MLHYKILACKSLNQFMVFLDQMSNPWPIDDSGEPSQIPHGKFFFLI